MIAWKDEGSSVVLLTLLPSRMEPLWETRVSKKLSLSLTSLENHLLILFLILMLLVRYAVRQRTQAAHPFNSSALLWWMAVQLPRYVIVPQLRNKNSFLSTSPLLRRLAK